MADTKTFVANAPVWVDLASKDAAAARDYYARLFGWKSEVGGPETGGYALAKLGGKDVAGIGPVQDPNAPSVWNVYIGTRDAAATAKKVEEAGGKVIAPPFKVLDQGTMAVFQDPSGAFISVWQPNRMLGAEATGSEGAYAWAELNARGIDKAEGFYTTVFGLTTKKSPMGEGQGEYIEFQLNGQSVAGGMEMNPMVPDGVPSYWLVYFGAADVDKTHRKAVELGGREIAPPMDFPGGRFSILSDPQGAAFGLLSMRQG